MKLRLFSVAMIQALGLYHMSEAVPIHNLAEADGKADTKVTAEADAESAIEALADVDAAAAAKLKAVTTIKNQITTQVENQIKAAIESAAETNAENCGDDRFDLFAGPNQFDLSQLTLEGLDAEAFDQPITFEINSTINI